MRAHLVLIVLGAALVTACSKDSPPASSPTMTTGGASQPSRVDVEAIRATLLREHPDKADVIRGLRITEEGNVVTLSGVVFDEGLQRTIISRIQAMPGVRGIDDQIQRGSGSPGTGGTPQSQQMQQRPGQQPSSGSGQMQPSGQSPGVGSGGTDTGSTMTVTPVEAVRMTMLRERPNDADVIRSLLITETGNVIELRGTVPDEKTRKGLVDAARKGSSAKSVKDEMTVTNKGKR